ncbi:hypothetical protein [Kitasatospora azatica]|uniref:hypothetical protein n=1 Tax=Kitasatospora azatica TaxID=58347 RepID=UPI000569EC3E|nr:hypothetical protein [Kitasatospora azatica]
MTTPVSKTDAELAELDVPVLLRFGLGADGPHRRALFGEGAVAAALLADRQEVQPRSLTFLAEVVRAGGVRYATGLPEPLPTPAATALARQWLDAAAMVTTDPTGDALAARWLDAVAAILELRRGSGS